ncbi:hypothetical protein [Acidovorax sp. SUPP3334]|uniref:hypothetical protein n=1 Tax=Acidovorax sp. SUPP3334 TaxID=2920881 RepID=UPI0024E0CB67|nr:hypothetical protein [Acidovorax sp. SUPP3334]
MKAPLLRMVTVPLALSWPPLLCTDAPDTVRLPATEMMPVLAPPPDTPAEVSGSLALRTLLRLPLISTSPPELTTPLLLMLATCTVSLAPASTVPGLCT